MLMLGQFIMCAPLSNYTKKEMRAVIRFIQSERVKSWFRAVRPSDVAPSDLHLIVALKWELGG